MRFALKELVRRPGRFVAAAAILALVSLLIVYLGGIIDGTVRAGTGALRALDGRLLVYSGQAQLAIPDSRIDAQLRRQVEQLEGVERVDGLGLTQLAGRLSGADARDVIDLTLIGFEHAVNQLLAPPEPGTAYADSTLASRVAIGSKVLVGMARTPVTVVGYVSDTTFDGQSTLWTDLDTWRSIQTVERPLRAPGDDGVQVLVVTPEPDRISGLASRIDSATASATQTVTTGDAVAGLPGVEGTRSVFTAVIAFTTFIGIVVVALLFALLVVERVALFGVLVALGVRSSNLFLALALQAIAIAVAAAAVGTVAGVSLGEALTSGNSSATFTAGRLLTSGALVVGAALLGAGITLRRILRIDPASAIGTAS